MPHDPERVAETRPWFVRAAENLRAADFERTADPPLTADIVFHAQQAAEAALALAREVRQAVLERLPEEVRP